MRVMALVHDRELVDIIVDGRESAKSLKRPGMAKLLAMVDAGKVQTVIIAKLDRLVRRCSWTPALGFEMHTTREINPDDLQNVVGILQAQGGAELGHRSLAARDDRCDHG